jgi:hypothetical protein
LRQKKKGAGNFKYGDIKNRDIEKTEYCMTNIEVLQKWGTFDVKFDVTIFLPSSQLFSNLLMFPFFLMFPNSMSPSFPKKKMRKCPEKCQRFGKDGPHNKRFIVRTKNVEKNNL